MKIWELLSSGKNKNTAKQSDKGMASEIEIQADRNAGMETDTIIVRKKLIFKGNVQFVGFRYRAKCFADELGLTGYVENLDNGNVLMEVQGTEEKIRKLIQCLEESRPIRIDAIKEEQLKVKQERGFQYFY